MIAFRWFRALCILLLCLGSANVSLASARVGAGGLELNIRSGSRTQRNGGGSAQVVPTTCSGITAPIANARLRSGPGTAYGVIGSAKKCLKVVASGINAANDWVQLSSGGWISRALVANLPGGLQVVSNYPALPTTVPPTSVPATAVPAVATAAPVVMLAGDAPQLSVRDYASVGGYDRATWKHWSDADGDCQNTRAEVLIAESLEPVTFTNSKNCTVLGGRWYDPYTNTYFTVAGELDVDHFVPLGNAHSSGGADWGADRKRDFANSLNDADHLIAVSASANRSKGSRAPDEWKPPNQGYWCEYAYDWMRVKNAWGLSATQSEWSALQSMTATCPAGFTAANALGGPANAAPPAVEVPAAVAEPVAIATVAPSTGSDTSSPVKMSNSKICHAPGTQYYDRTKNFTPYNTVADCQAAGGRLPK